MVEWLLNLLQHDPGRKVMSRRTEGYLNLCLDIYRADEYGLYEDTELGYCVDWTPSRSKGVINQRLCEDERYHKARWKLGDFLRDVWFLPYGYYSPLMVSEARDAKRHGFEPRHHSRSIVVGPVMDVVGGATHPRYGALKRWSLFNSSRCRGLISSRPPGTSWNYADGGALIHLLPPPKDNPPGPMIELIKRLSYQAIPWSTPDETF